MQTSATQLEPLGRNRGGYGGETIDVPSLMSEAGALAASSGWRVEPILNRGGRPPVLGIRRGDADASSPVYVSAGIHGDEPAGPLAALELLRPDAWPPERTGWLCPCLNPDGMLRNRRENAGGIDLNRDYRNPRSEEVTAHVGWLERQPRFDVAICLHEDWEAKGFYLYELNGDGRPSPAEAVVDAVSRICPIDLSPVIDGRPARHGIIRPDYDPVGRLDWPEAFFLRERKSRYCVTFEAPSDFRLEIRAQALVTAVQVLLAR